MDKVDNRRILVVPKVLLKKAKKFWGKSVKVIENKPIKNG